MILLYFQNYRWNAIERSVHSIPLYFHGTLEYSGHEYFFDATVKTAFGGFGWV